MLESLSGSLLLLQSLSALLESSPDLDSGCVIVLKSSISEDGFAILDHFYLKPCFVNTARINFRFFLNEGHMSRLLGRQRAGPSRVPQPRRVLLRACPPCLRSALKRGGNHKGSKIFKLIYKSNLSKGWMLAGLWTLLEPLSVLLVLLPQGDPALLLGVA